MLLGSDSISKEIFMSSDGKTLLLFHYNHTVKIKSYNSISNMALSFELMTLSEIRDADEETLIETLRRCRRDYSVFPGDRSDEPRGEIIEKSFQVSVHVSSCIWGRRDTFM